MKKWKKLLSVGLAFAAAFLFTESSIGINAAIFSSISVLFLRIAYREIPNSRLLLIALPHLGIALFLSLYPQLLSKVFWYFSFGIMWTAAAVDLRPILIPLQALASIIVSPFKSLKADADSPASNATTSLESSPSVNVDNQGTPKALAYLLAALIVTIFVLLYVSANPVLQSYVEDLNFEYLNVQMLQNIVWYLLAFYGLIVLYPSDVLIKRSQKDLSLKAEDYKPEAQGEFRTGITSLWVLSAILLLVNGVDIFVLLSGHLPEGLSYAEFVHQGFYTLLFSIVLAILLILFFFRGALNFHPQLEKLRKAARMWLFQNLALTAITGAKLFMYIGAYGLSYLRITVLLCLLCVSIGLLLSFKKIQEHFKNTRFFNQMALYAYFAAFFFALMPYDLIITRYNLAYVKNPDLNYLVHLPQPDHQSIYQYALENKYDSYYINYSSSRLVNIKEQFTKHQNWREWNLYSAQMSKHQL